MQFPDVHRIRKSGIKTEIEKLILWRWILVGDGDIGRGGGESDDDISSGDSGDKGLRTGERAEIQRRMCADRVDDGCGADDSGDAGVGRFEEGDVRAVEEEGARDLQGRDLLARCCGQVAGVGDAV
ncbi:unnamed protein product [Rhodiola kirilowii]